MALASLPKSSKALCHGHCDRPSRSNHHSYRDHTGLETDIHLSKIEPGIKCKELVPG